LVTRQFVRQPIQVLVYPVRRTAAGNWEYLLMRRIPSRGGFWQGVTGGVERDEDVTEAATRELIEETALVPSDLQIIDYSYSFPVEHRFQHLYHSGTETIMEHVFMARITAEQEPKLSEEHDQYRWCTFNEALCLLGWPGNIEALKKCNRILTSGSRGQYEGP
jgi:8-oxo-dGTP pyrophosphatase MutT (NUDIX family)